ncbi:MAG: hypothetical protein ACXWT0_01845 [Methylobacter sp.]
MTDLTEEQEFIALLRTLNAEIARLSDEIQKLKTTKNTAKMLYEVYGISAAIPFLKASAEETA